MRILVSFAKPEKVRKYKDSIRGVGGPGVEVGEAWSAVAPPADGWGALAQGFDGLLLSGGVDVEPARYGETLDPAAGVEVLPVRDAMEWDLLAAARARRIPVLGICRGHQVVNAFLGGTLWQDLGALGAGVRAAHRHDPDRRRELAHSVEAVPGAHPLQALFSARAPFPVNSFHHQAVKSPGRGMVVAATGPGGVIEATGLADPDWWVWSVQWHPEELVEAGDHPFNRTLFEHFLEAAATRSRQREGVEVTLR
ncbi:MAG: gamma-glutamyl-gamma-aminobutyrate hydrolase family protein [Thermoanaerobaculia bacterium]|nr:MAG: gamma-glutamyl-gamma-aminobutyrate hydrolase family protein [Thermoanaerobaculia bacterium]